MKVPFLFKIKTMLLGSTIYEDNKIQYSALIRFTLHILNLLYVLGGWIFISHYLDNIFNGNISVFISLLLIVSLNLIIIYFSPLQLIEEKEK